MTPVRHDLASACDVDPKTGCWVWNRGTNGNGYGTVWDGSRKTYAHRLSYEQSVGPIPAGQEIDHNCRNRLCINPAHLEPVPHGTNMARAKQVKTRCLRDHLYTPESTGYQTSSKGYRTRYCKICDRGKRARRAAETAMRAA